MATRFSGGFPYYLRWTVCHMMFPGHTVYTTACRYTRQRVHRACHRDCKDRSVSIPLARPSPSVSVACSGPVFMRVSMGKGSATRTRRKIISDLPRARRSCRPPYIARRSVLRRIFEMETRPPLALPLRPAVAIAFQQRSFDGNSKRKKKREEKKNKK